MNESGKICAQIKKRVNDRLRNESEVKENFIMKSSVASMATAITMGASTVLGAATNLKAREKSEQKFGMNESGKICAQIKKRVNDRLRNESEVMYSQCTSDPWRSTAHIVGGVLAFPKPFIPCSLFHIGYTLAACSDQQGVILRWIFMWR
jgi:ribosomal protein S30